MDRFSTSDRRAAGHPMPRRWSVRLGTTAGTTLGPENVQLFA